MADQSHRLKSLEQVEMEMTRLAEFWRGEQQSKMIVTASVLGSFADSLLVLVREMRELRDRQQ